MDMLGENIRKYRLAANLTQNEMARKLNISDITISRYESGQRRPSIDMIFNISDILNVEIADLLELPPTLDDMPQETVNKLVDEMHERETDAYFEVIQGYESSSAEYKIKMLNSFDRLNLTGKEKAAERVEELTYIDKYTRKE